MMPPFTPIPIIIPPRPSGDGSDSEMTGLDVALFVLLVLAITGAFVFLLLNIAPVTDGMIDAPIVESNPSSRGPLFRDLVVEHNGIRYPSAESVVNDKCSVGNIATGHVRVYWRYVPKWSKVKIDVRWCLER